MSELTRTPNFEDPDGFYADLVAAHQGLPEEASALLNARLVLILANHVGDREVLRQALALARAALVPTGEQLREGAADCNRPDAP